MRNRILANACCLKIEKPQCTNIIAVLWNMTNFVIYQSANEYIVAIDQGTSSSRVILFDVKGHIVASHQMEHQQIYPKPGYIEHSPEEIWNNVKVCLLESIKKVSADSKFLCIGITNQRETTVMWNRDTGKPYHNAIVWNDTRTSGICDEMIEKFGHKSSLHEKTGLPIASYFSLSKIMYLQCKCPEIMMDSSNGKALFGTMDSWLLWNLTNRNVHSTDVTNASRTLMMNIHDLQWDYELLSALNIPSNILPSILPSSSNFGFAKFEESSTAQNELKLLEGVPITGILGDQHAALFGQMCFNSGEAKCTYGTGAFLLMNTGEDAVYSSNGLITTVAYQIADKKPIYALEGSVAFSGSLIQWLRDNLQIISHASQTEEVASAVEGSGGVYFVPAFSGLFAPYWRDDARAAIVGLTAYNNKSHIVRAALEASAFQTVDVVEAMSSDFGMQISSLKVDGGMTSNNLAMQFQSNLLQVPLHRPAVTETTCLGAALIAGLGKGVWENTDQIKQIWRADKEWRPTMTSQKREKLITGWKKAVARTLFWNMNEEETRESSKDPFLSYLKQPKISATKSRMPEVEGMKKVSSKMHNNLKFSGLAAATGAGVVLGFGISLYV